MAMILCCYISQAFQRRFDGSEDFYRGWEDYEQGFGKADSEYWLGKLNHYL